jgi:hypothetical protein
MTSHVNYRCPTGRAVPARVVPPRAAVPDGSCMWRARAWPPAQEHGVPCVPRAAREQRTGRKLGFGVMERGREEQRHLGEGKGRAAPSGRVGRS